MLELLFLFWEDVESVELELGEVLEAVEGGLRAQGDMIHDHLVRQQRNEAR